MHTSSVAASRGNRMALHKLCVGLLGCLVMFGFSSSGRGQTVTLASSVASPQMVGTPVTWTAAVANPASGHTYDYRFSVTLNGVSQIVSDFSPVATFTWVPHTVEGSYKFSVAVRDTTTKPYVRFTSKAVPFELLPYVTAPLAPGAVNPTSHPLVALFSGPPCATGHQLLVRFHPASSQVSMTTSPTACSSRSANFYVAGMYPSTQYLMHWEEYDGSTLVNTGADLSYKSGPFAADFPTKRYVVNVPPSAHDAAYPVVLFQTGPYATDLQGNVIWYGTYGAAGIGIVRMETGGYFYAYPTNTDVVLYDMALNVVMRTNVARLNEQLAAKGYPQISLFNAHEARNLPDGKIALLGYRTISSTTAQGGTPSKPVNIVGDMILVVDKNLQLTWAWDSFAHEDINRMATDGDVCAMAAGCPAAVGQDWLHSNAAQGTADGNIVLSQRSQDWVIKINYDNGRGNGDVIWRMGPGGDFTMNNPPSGSCGDPNLIPWFTHQHDPDFQFQDAGSGLSLMTVFDDGNTRHDKCPGTQNSRGMILLVDEPNRKVYLETAADLGSYSAAVGAAQLLDPGDGNLYGSFDSGFLNNYTETQLSETTLGGQINYQIQLSQGSYRAYRMKNLDTPSEFESAPGVSTNVLPPDQPFNFSTGFSHDQDALQFNGNAALLGDTLRLTDGEGGEISSVFYESPVDVHTFTTDFKFVIGNPDADGFTFTIQNNGPSALGTGGGSLGYGGIDHSVAVKFDIFQNEGETSSDSTGVFVNGADPIGAGTIDLTGSGIDLHSRDQMDARLTYNGTTLTLMLTDLVTQATWSHSFTLDIPGTIGSDTAYVGFTASTGGAASLQDILSWSYSAAQVPYNPNGFAGGSSVSTNGSAAISGSILNLTDGKPNEAGSSFFVSPVNVQSFTTDFDFKLSNATGDGFTFTIQGDGPTALGAPGGSLGYRHIDKSIAIKFDLFDNAGEGSDSTGLYFNGANPTLPAINLSNTVIDLHSGDAMNAHMTYSGSTLTLTITDLVTNKKWAHPFVVNIPAVVGGNTAYVGFTAGTGGSAAVQQILNWTFE